MSTATKRRRSGSVRVESQGSRGPRDALMSRATAMVIMGVFTLYFLMPLWWLLVASSKNKSDVFTTNPLWFADFQMWANVGDLFSYDHGVYLKWLVNSAIYAGLGGAVATLLAAMAGYALAKYRFRGRDVMFNVILGGVLVPATALALPLFLLFSKVGLTNTFWAVFIPSIVRPLAQTIAAKQ